MTKKLGGDALQNKYLYVLPGVRSLKSSRINWLLVSDL